MGEYVDGGEIVKCVWGNTKQKGGGWKEYELKLRWRCGPDAPVIHNSELPDQ
jgi:hypothetical protein